MYPNWVAPFLHNLERTGNVSGSARVAGIASGGAYQRRKTDGDFAAAWDLAIEDHTDCCEQELTRRAFGYQEPVVHQGQLSPVWERDEKGQVKLEVYNEAGDTRPVQALDGDGRPQWLTVTKFSDTLLLARVKAYRKRYSTDRTEVVNATPLDDMTDAELIAEFNALSKKIAALPKPAGTDDDTVYA